MADPISEARLIDIVWRKGIEVANEGSDVWRKDIYGDTIYFHAYGDRTSDWGWEIDYEDGKTDSQFPSPTKLEKHSGPGEKPIWVNEMPSPLE